MDSWAWKVAGRSGPSGELAHDGCMGDRDRRKYGTAITDAVIAGAPLGDRLRDPAGERFVLRGEYFGAALGIEFPDDFDACGLERHAPGVVALSACAVGDGVGEAQGIGLLGEADGLFDEEPARLALPQGW